MNFWNELKTRWMYWRYRNITRNRQRMQLKWSARRNRNPVYMAPTGRGIRPVRPGFATGIGRTWSLLIIVSLAMATLQHYQGSSYGSDVVLLGDVAILACAYLIWLKTDTP